MAHDAGAANHIFAWLRTNRRFDVVTASLAGPAMTLWQQQHGTCQQLELNDVLAGAKTLLSGTGWASSIEHDARRLARQFGVKSIAVIDHWTNFRERFLRNGEEILPDEIWVSDEYAQAMATAMFSNIKVIQQPNAYLADLVSEVQRLELSLGAHTADERLLYVLEPIRHAWGQTEILGEFAALDFFVENLSLLQIGQDTQIRLRPHPSDPVGKYDEWLARQRNLKIEIDPLPNLAASLAWSSLVVGCQTYAMVVALAAGRQVVSSIPPWAPACVLPHPEIIKLSTLAL